jgi:hypothetical protein
MSFYASKTTCEEQLPIQAISIDIENVNNADCIAFSVDKDILQFVCLNSNYSLETQQKLGVDYNFKRIEALIETKLLAGKKIFNISSIPLIQFCDEINDSTLFEDLHRKLNQDELSPKDKQDLISEFNQPIQLTELIRKLRIVIDFIVTCGCSSTNMKIVEYTTNVLKMDLPKNVHSIIANLETVYLRSILNVLFLKRGILLTGHNQDPFDQLDSKFKAEFLIPSQTEQNKENEEQGDTDESASATKKLQKFRDYVIQDQKINFTNFFSFLNAIYRLITYKLIKTSNIYNQSNTSIGASQEETDGIELYAEMDFKDFIQEFSCEDLLNKETYALKEYNLRDLKVKHAFSIWKLFVFIYLEIKK